MSALFASFVCCFSVGRMTQTTSCTCSRGECLGSTPFWLRSVIHGDRLCKSRRKEIPLRYLWGHISQMIIKAFDQQRLYVRISCVCMWKFSEKWYFHWASLWSICNRLAATTSENPFFSSISDRECWNLIQRGKRKTKEKKEDNKRTCAFTPRCW